MKILKFLIFSLLLTLIYINNLFGNETSSFVLMTIPKSGSHLAIKALHYLTGGTPIWHTRFPSLFYIPPKDGFLYTHLVISKDLEDDYLYLPQLKRILNIRDLRDVAVSMVGHILQMPWPGMTSEEIDLFKKMSFNDQLLFVIQYNYEIKPNDPIALQVSLPKLAQQAISYFNDPNILVCKYENLVGPLGGSSCTAQVDELRKIVTYLTIPDLSDRDLVVIADHLYGDKSDIFKKQGFEHYASTFRRGQIGSWKQFFTEEHKIAFKTALGQALIDLGYEKDFDW